MKGYIKIVLLILISCCYVNTVFEFSDTEEKANFENESHAYIQQFSNQTFANNVTQSIPHCDINCDTPIQFHLSAITPASKCNSFYKISFFPKRDKLFILYSSFLIWWFSDFTFLGNCYAVVSFTISEQFYFIQKWKK